LSTKHKRDGDYRGKKERNTKRRENHKKTQARKDEGKKETTLCDLGTCSVAKQVHVQFLTIT
jgi:hypothetical protein